MSYTPPPPSSGPTPFAGQNAPYVPPPPPPTKKSPWLFVGLGCGLLILLSFGGCALFISNVAKQTMADLKKPIDKKEVMAGIGDIPVYPGSQFSEIMTKAQRSVFGNPLMKSALRGATPHVAAFDTKDDTDKVVAWYDKKMDSLGYEPANSTSIPNMGNGTTEQKQYRKGNDMALIQAQRNPKQDTGFKTVVVIVRMENVKE